MTKKVSTKLLTDKIAKLVRERVSASDVVDLNEVKNLSSKKARSNILIVEDDETIRKSLERILIGDSYKVLVASDGAELTHVLDETAIDLILLDIGLPWIDGFELAEMMKSHEDLKHVPIVFISGSGDLESIKKGFQVGAHDFIKKPFDIEKVKATVRALLELSRR